MAQLAEFATDHLLLVSGLFGAWILVMVYELRLKAQSLTNMTTTDSVNLINEGAMIIDVRSSESYKSGHIVNSRNIALDDLSSDKVLTKKQKTKTLLTVCDDGSSSGKAANLLRQAGYDKSFSLKGGLRGWQADNLPLVK
ncbi:MAG TPA: rhodanese-like domain-containing protein [Gammaproteobacteria bacterium]|nr:rhodanese-like domain-containing protein [Gammaproteobacteria bacterium]